MKSSLASSGAEVVALQGFAMSSRYVVNDASVYVISMLMMLTAAAAMMTENHDDDDVAGCRP